MPVVVCPQCSAQLRLPDPPPPRAGCPRCKTILSGGRQDLVGPPKGGVGGRTVLLMLAAAGVVGFGLLTAVGVGAWLLWRAPEPAADGTGPAEAPAAQAPAAAPAHYTPEEVNRRLLRSTVFVLQADPGSRSVGLGSGALVHWSRRLVVTNYHVVGTAPNVGVFFPDYDRKGELVTAPKHYADNAKRLLIPAKVAARDAAKDLAVLELERLPGGVAPLPLARQPAATGAAVYSVGASGVRLDGDGGAFWRFSVGTVRGRHRDDFRIQTGQAVSAMILETQKPVNPGDSGGPTVNDRAELVGVVAAFDQRQNLVMKDIDLTEVRDFLAKAARDRGWAWADDTAAPAAGPGSAPAGPVARPGESPPLPPTDAKADLLARLKAPDPAARVEAARQLGDQKDAARWAVPTLIGSLDDPDDRVRRMAAVALDLVGPPAPEDAGCLVAALGGGKRFARLHALRHFAAAEKAPRDALPAVVAALDAPDPDTREAAAAAVGFYGPDARPAALAKLLARATDPDPAVARAVARVLDGLGPYAGADRQPLVAALGGPDPALRYLAVRLLAPAAADAAAAADLFRPRLADPAAPVREQAVRGLGKWGPAAKAVAPDLVRLLDDPDARVRAAAVWAVGEVGSGPGAAAALGKHLAADDPLLRAAAAKAALRVGVTDPADLPVLKALLAFDDPGTRVAALDAAARLGPAARELVAEAAAALGSPEPAVRAAALRVLAAAGPAAAPHAAKAFDLLAAPSPAPPAPPRPPAAPAGEQVADRLTRSAVWVLVEEYGRVAGSGSGTLIDGPNRLVLTNHHVVEGGDSFLVFFPTRSGGAVATRPADYLGRAAALARTRHAATGRVVASDPGLDLAVIRLDAAPPDDAAPLPLAAESARPGQSLHSVGASGAGLGRGDGVLWRYTAGKARAVFDHRLVLDGVQPVACRVVETDMPTNPGDSGSAVANDAGELVGVNFAVDRKNRAVSYAVELEAVRRVVARAGGKPAAGGTLVAGPPAAPAAADDPVREAAAAALAGMGPAATDLVIRGLGTNPPAAAAARLVAALGDRAGTLPRAGVLAVFDAAEKAPAARAAAADVLVKVGGDEVSQLLRERTAWSVKGTGASRVKVGKFPPDVSLWAVRTLGRLDPTALTPRGRELLVGTLEGLADRDLDPEGRREARAALDRLTDAGIRGPAKRP